MKIVLRLLYPSVLLLSALTASSQWTQTNGPYGGNVSSLAIGEGYIVAGTLGGGVFLSSDRGATWSPVNTGLTQKFVRALVAIPSQNGPSHLYAGTAGGGVFVSTNNGAQWSSADSGLSSTFVYAFASSGSFLFAGTQSGVSFSTDGGIHWKGIGPAAIVRALVAYSDSGRINLLAGTAGGIIASNDTGATWTVLNAGLTSTIVYALTLDLSPGGESHLLAGTVGGGVFLSTNRGLSWTSSNAGLTALQIYALASDSAGNAIYAGAFDGGVFRSGDNGTTWSSVNNGLDNRMVLCLAVGVHGTTSPDLFAGTNGGGVFVSTDDGGEWIPSSAGLSPADINALASIDEVRLLTGTVGTGVVQSTNGGNDWQPANPGLTSFDVRTFLIAGDSSSGRTILAGTYGGGMFRVHEDSSVWRDANSGLDDSIKGFRVYALALNDSNVFAATANGIYVSTNAGDSWSGGGLSGVDVRALTILSSPVDTPAIFAGSQGGGIYRSTTNGVSWNAMNTGLTNPSSDYYVYAISANGSHLFAGTFGGLFVSSNSGSSWKKADSLVVYSFVTDGTIVYTGTSNSGVRRSTNNGNSWENVSNGLTTPDVRALAIVDSIVYAGTYGGGVWRLPLREVISSVHSSEELAEGFSLGQNYPNPFNPTTTITFEIPVGTRHAVSLRVYDLLGREVATLAQGVHAPGTYVVQLDGSGLSSGVYFYRIVAEVNDVGGHERRFVKTKRLMMLK